MTRDKQSSTAADLELDSDDDVESDANVNDLQLLLRQTGISASVGPAHMAPAPSVPTTSASDEVDEDTIWALYDAAQRHVVQEAEQNKQPVTVIGGLGLNHKASREGRAPQGIMQSAVLEHAPSSHSQADDKAEVDSLKSSSAAPKPNKRFKAG